jgi:hypothetical protein
LTGNQKLNFSTYLKSGNLIIAGNSINEAILNCIDEQLIWQNADFGIYNDIRETSNGNVIVGGMAGKTNKTPNGLQTVLTFVDGNFGDLYQYGT